MAKTTVGQLQYAGRTFGSWARGWLTVVTQDGSPQPDVDILYTHLMARLKRAILLVMIGLMLTFGTFSCVKLFMRAQITYEMPPAAFMVQVLNVALSLVFVTPLFLTNRINAAWLCLYSISMLAILAQIYVFENPGIILYALLLIVGPAILAPFLLHLLITFATVLLTSLIVLFLFSGPPPIAWTDVVSLFIGVAIGYGLIGVMIRHTVKELAAATVEMKNSEVREARLAQQLDDLHRHVTTLATLEHDIRQPIRSIEGYLQFMQAAPNGIDNASLLTAARAANQRANRLVSNLLEVARSSIQQPQHKVQTIQGADILASIQAVTPGLARYYSDPPAVVIFAIDGTPPAMALDAEQMQRAILNLLDNALAHTPPGGAITVHSRFDGEDWLIAVQDSGPGIPASILQALQNDAPPPVDSIRGPHLGLGLRQVYATAAAHGGSVTIDTTPHGSTVQIRLPVQPAE